MHAHRHREASEPLESIPRADLDRLGPAAAMIALKPSTRSQRVLENIVSHKSKTIWRKLNTYTDAH